MNAIHEFKTRAFGKTCRTIGWVEYLACYAEWPFFGMCRMVTDWDERVDDNMYWFTMFKAKEVA